MNNFDKANQKYNSGQFEDALCLYQKSIQGNREDCHSLYNAAVCLIKLRNFSEAIEYLKKALTIQKDSKYFFNLGYCYVMLNEKALALQYFNTAWSYDNSDEDCEKSINIILKFLRKV